MKQTRFRSLKNGAWRRHQNWFELWIPVFWSLQKCCSCSGDTERYYLFQYFFKKLKAGILVSGYSVREKPLACVYGTWWYFCGAEPLESPCSAEVGRVHLYCTERSAHTGSHGCRCSSTIKLGDKLKTHQEKKKKLLVWENGHTFSTHFISYISYMLN